MPFFVFVVAFSVTVRDQCLVRLEGLMHSPFFWIQTPRNNILTDNKIANAMFLVLVRCPEWVFD